jgi:hypothetical protein
MAQKCKENLIKKIAKINTKLWSWDGVKLNQKQYIFEKRIKIMNALK